VGQKHVLRIWTRKKQERVTGQALAVYICLCFAETSEAWETSGHRRIGIWDRCTSLGKDCIVYQGFFSLVLYASIFFFSLHLPLAFVSSVFAYSSFVVPGRGHTVFSCLLLVVICLGRSCSICDNDCFAAILLFSELATKSCL
jgi:hypothetical protein